MNEVFLESVVLGRKLGLNVTVFGQGTEQHILNQIGLTCHALGQLARAGDGLRSLGDEIPQQVFKGLKILRSRLHPHNKISDPNRC